MNNLPAELENCVRCPRLVKHRNRTAKEKRKAYRNQPYWGRPVPGFGDPKARVIIIGLAPGAHGSNRTGRMFTGDASGDFLYPALHRAGFSNRARSVGMGDGLTLQGVWITSAARCVPPGNRPHRKEIAACREWLNHDISLISEARVVLALGHIAHDSYIDLLKAKGKDLVKSRHPFSHGQLHQLEGQGIPLLDSYHVSFQNTNTGRLTECMFDKILARVRKFAEIPTLCH
jgi:uracil-DNA glycosylase family 4